MAEKTIQIGVEVAVDQKDISDLNTLEKRLKALTSTYKMYVDLVNSGQVSMGSKISFGDNKYTRKQFEQEIQNTKRVLDEANKVMSSNNSFGEYFKKYNENLAIIRNNTELYKKLEDKNTDEAKRLMMDVSNARKRNSRIRNNTVGVFDFKAYEKKWNKSRDLKDHYNAGKEQLAIENRTRRERVATAKRAAKEQATAEKQASRDAFNSWSALYKEREGINKELSKVSDTSSKHAEEARKRLQAIDSDMTAIINKWGSNKDFAKAKASIEQKTASANIISGLSSQYSNEKRSLASMMSDIKNNMGHLTLRKASGNWNKEDAKNLRELTQEYRRLEKAMRDTNKLVGKSDLSKFGANIKSHLHWMISGALVDGIYEFANSIKDTSVEVDNLSRKITQNIELSGEFETNKDKLHDASRDLVFSSFEIANRHGMQMQDILEMMQIMSRRFKDPALLKYYTDLAAIMSKLDFVDPAVAAESLEAIVISFGLSTQEAAQFVNEFSIATHTMRINGQDLLEAFQRSAPTMKQFGLSTAESVALVSTLSTTLGREGKYIGNAINGIFVRFLNEKNQNFFESIGISMTKANGEIKSAIEIMREYKKHYDSISDVEKLKELSSILGAYRMVPGTSAIKDIQIFFDALGQIKEKASDAQTEELEGLQLESHESKINRFNNALKMSSYLIGDALAPAITSVLEAINDLIAGIVEFERYNKGTTAGILYLIIVLGSLIAAIQTVNSSFWGNTVKAFTMVTGSTKRLSKAINKLGIEMLSTNIASNTLGRGFGVLNTRAKIAFAGITAAAIRTAGVLGFVIGLAQLIGEHYDLKKAQYIIGTVSPKELEQMEKNNPEEYAKVVAAQNANEKLNSKNYQQKLAIAQDGSTVNELGIDPEETISQEQKQKDDIIKGAGVVEALRSGELFKNAATEVGGGEDGGDDGTGGGDSGDGSKTGDRNYAEYTRNLKNTKAKELKRKYDNSKKLYENDIGILDFDDELYGKTVSSFINRNRLRSDRKNYLLGYQDKVNAELKSLEQELKELEGKKDEDEITKDGRTTTVGELKSALIEAKNDIESLAVSITEDLTNINKETRKSYTTSYEEQIEREKKRNENSKQIEQLKADNKRNAWNYMVQNDIEIKHEMKNNEILYKDYKKHMDDRMKLEQELLALKQLNADAIAKYGRSQYDADIKAAEAQIENYRDIEQEKQLEYLKSNEKIEELQKKQTEKIREGLHGVAHDLLLEGKSMKDIWKNLWADLAEEALRALMRIEGGQQSTLGAIAASLGGLGGSSAKGGKGKGSGGGNSGNLAKYGGNTLGLEYGGHISHDGSIIGVTPLNTRYYHNGGNVGTAVVPYLKSDEVNAVLQTGEEVVSRKDRRSNELMSEQNKHMADAMQRMADGSNTHVTFAIQAIDSKSVVQLLNENGDAIMNILRKQSAYGNGRI